MLQFTVSFVYKISVLPNKKRKRIINISGNILIHICRMSEKAKKEREKERREQYKQVRAHVKKDDGRLQAYGWSLPAKFQAVPNRESSAKSQVPVPVPVYCRPLFDKDSGLKVLPKNIAGCLIKIENMLILIPKTCVIMAHTTNI